MQLRQDYHALPTIALVIGQLSHGGAERQLTLLVSELQKQCGFSPVVFCMSNAIEPYGNALTAAGVDWYAPPLRAHSKLHRLWWLIRELSKSRYSLVYGILNTGNIYGGAAAMVARLPFMGSIRSADANLPSVLRFLSGFFCRRAHLVVANSPSCVESLRNDLRVTHSRIRIIPNAVVLPEVALNTHLCMRQRWGIPADAFLVGTLANLKAEKRVSFFLQVAASMHQLGSVPLHFVWIGEGPERAHIAKYLEPFPSALADTVHFPGASLEVADCLAAFDAFVLTSSYEGLPSALLEAMAAGLPCIATNVAGSRDVIEALVNSEIGVLADPEDPVRFASGLLDLIRNPDRMRRLGENAAQHVKAKYGLETMVREFCNAFDGVIRTNARQGDTSSW